MSRDTDYEAAVKRCYSTWSQTYIDDYYGKNAAYPPVHVKHLRKLLRAAKVRNVLDAGCGPGSFLREITSLGIDLYGFDLTPEMVAEARSVLGKKKVPPDHLWEGSVTSRAAFRAPGRRAPRQFDAAVCIGVLPHVPERADAKVIRNLHDCVKKNGLVVLEARNQLFALFTQNRYSHQLFLDALMPLAALREASAARAAALDGALDELKARFRTDLPPVRTGKQDEPGYDQVLSRTHNPLVLREQFAAAGFRDVDVMFYHYHCMPPMFEPALGPVFREQSLAMEDPHDWRGHFMASAFLIVGRRA